MPLWLQIAAAEAAAKADAQEVEGWKRDAPAVLAALETSHAEKIAEVPIPELSWLLSSCVAWSTAVDCVTCIHLWENLPTQGGLCM